jgi:hypothetical protein
MRNAQQYNSAINVTPFYHFLSLGVNRIGWTQTINLEMMRQVFYLSATTVGE